MDINTTLAERGSRYGSFDEHARITQAIKRAMADTPNWATLPDAMKESLEMAAHKMGRILNGDPNYDDSWIDIVGYTQLVINGLHGKNDSGVSVGSDTANSSPPQPTTPARAEKLQADDGWIEWGGGLQPLNNDTLVDVRLKDGDEYKKVCPNDFHWGHRYGPSNIIAYRLAKEPA